VIGTFPFESVTPKVCLRNMFRWIAICKLIEQEGCQAWIQ
jgi:hypothetical protein